VEKYVTAFIDIVLLNTSVKSKSSNELFTKCLSLTYIITEQLTDFTITNINLHKYRN